jgi:hypothetical protein
VIFLGTIAAYGLWPEIRAAVLPQQAAILTPRAPL